MTVITLQKKLGSSEPSFFRGHLGLSRWIVFTTDDRLRLANQTAEATGTVMLITAPGSPMQKVPVQNPGLLRD
jgi:hypothetical protein